MFFGKKFSGYHGGPLSGLATLVLSMIKNNDGISGYKIIQKVNKKFKNVWRASPGTIYPLLNRLAQKKYVKVEEVTENNRQKKIYRITETGSEGLKNILENNLQPSIDTLGDFIQTVLKTIPGKKHFEKMFSCFPYAFPDHPKPEIKFDVTDYSLKNIEQIERIINDLKQIKERLADRINALDKRLEKYQSILNKIKTERDNHTRIIPISGDDEDF